MIAQITAPAGAFPELEKLHECFDPHTPPATVQAVWVALHRLDLATTQHTGSRAFREGVNNYGHAFGSAASLTRGDVRDALGFLAARGILPPWIAPRRTARGHSVPRPIGPVQA